jgi:hypothetical protein
VSESAELARREQGDALSTILGTGDTRAALGVLERNIRDIIEVARERGFVTHFRDVNKKTGEVRESDFYGFPTWQLLGMTYGVTPIVDILEPIDGGWKAHAVAQTRDGNVVGAAFGLCLRKEPGKQYKSDHDLAAMAQTRAMRNALRSALGAALVLAGFDFPDPDAPATNEQVGLLHQLEREIGWTHEQGHIEAGDVGSYKELTREEASTYIDRWTQIRDEAQGGHLSPPQADASYAHPDQSGVEDDAAPDEAGYASEGDELAIAREGEARAVAPSTEPSEAPHLAESPAEHDEHDNELADDAAWARAPHDMSRVGAIKLAKKLIDAGRIPGPVPATQAGFTRLQLAKVGNAWRDGERG